MKSLSVAVAKQAGLQCLESPSRETGNGLMQKDLWALKTYNETVIIALSPLSKSYKIRWYMLTVVLITVKSGIKQKYS